MNPIQSKLLGGIDTRLWILDAGFWLLDVGGWMMDVEGNGDLVIAIPMALPLGEVISILKKDCFGFCKKLNPRNDMK